MGASPSSFSTLRVNQVSGAIVSSAMHVHSVLGPGLLESAYQGCLAHELKSAVLSWLPKSGYLWSSTEKKIELGYRIDLVVENLVIVEIKSVDTLHPVHQAQLLSYMRLSGIGVGLLINFYVTHLRDGIKRMVDGRNWEN
jgi:GxxExxY protein